LPAAGAPPEPHPAGPGLAAGRMLKAGACPERRAFIGAVAGCLLAAPRSLAAQSAGPRRIGYHSLVAVDLAQHKPCLAAFRAGLREHGQVAGGTLVSTERY